MREARIVPRELSGRRDIRRARATRAVGNVPGAQRGRLWKIRLLARRQSKITG